MRRGPLLLYAVGFVLVWGFCLKSGVSTSVAGVACALTVPVGARRPGGESMLTLFMEALHPWVAYGVLPLFAFAAAGFSFKGFDAATLLSPVTLGIALALLVGKPLGAFGVAAGAALLRLGRRPSGATWLELYGVAQLTGVGFTMSLYLAALAFETPLVETQARLGVFAGSLASIARWARGCWRTLRRRRGAAGGEAESQTTRPPASARSRSRPWSPGTRGSRSRPTGRLLPPTRQRQPSGGHHAAAGASLIATWPACSREATARTLA